MLSLEWKKTLKSFDGNMTKLDARIGALESSVNQIQTQAKRLDNLEQEIRDVRAELADVEHSVQFCSGEIDDFKSSTDGMRRDIRKLQERTEQLSCKMSTVPTCTHRNETNEIRNDIRKLQEHTEQLSSKLSDVPARSAQPRTPLDNEIEHSEVTSRNEFLSSAQVRSILEGDTRQRVNQNNVIVSGLPEQANENLRDVLAELLPSVDLSHVTAYRIGRSTSTQPRLVKLCTSPTVKAQLMRQRFNLKYRDQNVYLGHDLTKEQRARRKTQVPILRKLRQHGVECSMPYDVILKNGKVMSDTEISAALSSSPVPSQNPESGAGASPQ